MRHRLTPEFAGGLRQATAVGVITVDNTGTISGINKTEGGLGYGIFAETAPDPVVINQMGGLIEGTTAAIAMDNENGDTLNWSGGSIKGLVDAVLGSGGDRLDSLVLTHLDRDHVGEFDRVLTRFEVGSVMVDRITREMRDLTGSVGSPVRRIGLGDAFRLGRVEVEVLWPPATPNGGTAGDRNARSVVLMVRFAGRRILLTGDAEAELVPLDPGPVDVLKVAHHGSEDQGLPDLLAGTMPALSLLSAGAGNPYGHPVDSTLAALRESGSEIYRTDRQGTVSVLLWPSGRIEVETAR